MLFGKKKETPKNPYYNGAAKQAGAAPVVNAQIPPPATIAKEMNQQQGTSENTGKFSVPLLPTPEPITLPNVEQMPLKIGGSLNALDIMKLGSETKAFAFVKLSDFKRILDDIRSLESKLNASQDELDDFTKLLKEQEDYLNRYGIVLKELRRTIDEIASSLSHVED